MATEEEADWCLSRFPVLAKFFMEAWQMNPDALREWTVRSLENEDKANTFIKDMKEWWESFNDNTGIEGHDDKQ